MRKLFRARKVAYEPLVLTLSPPPLQLSARLCARPALHRTSASPPPRAPHASLLHALTHLCRQAPLSECVPAFRRARPAAPSRETLTLFTSRCRAYGRYPLYVISSLVYLVFFIPTAYGQNIVRRPHLLVPVRALGRSPPPSLSHAGHGHHLPLYRRHRSVDGLDHGRRDRRRPVRHARARPPDGHLQHHGVRRYRARPCGQRVHRAQARMEVDQLGAGASPLVSAPAVRVVARARSCFER